MDAQHLQQVARDFDLQGQFYPTVKEALNSALKNASRNDMIFIGGSTFVVADALKAIEDGAIVLKAN
jgi:dihydrofolate synthase/folylpolyglutamate synthase